MRMMSNLPCPAPRSRTAANRSEDHTSELQSLAYLVCRLLLEKKKTKHVNSRNRDNINPILPAIHQLFTIYMNVNDLKTRTVFSRDDTKAQPQSKSMKNDTRATLQ